MCTYFALIFRFFIPLDVHGEWLGKGILGVWGPTLCWKDRKRPLIACVSDEIHVRDHPNTTLPTDMHDGTLEIKSGFAVPWSNSVWETCWPLGGPFIWKWMPLTCALVSIINHQYVVVVSNIAACQLWQWTVGANGIWECYHRWWFEGTFQQILFVRN